jgi:NAD(P)-dependent dehydrogenase (short-subunit alcohol dehydrogenase family)
MIRVLQWIAIVSLVLGLSAGVHAGDQSPQKAVLVTGASSGIGLKITEHLSSNGYYVYAGARKAADLKRLDAMDNVSSVRLDVTVQDEIDAAVEFVKAQGRGLYGVVNNAGVGAGERTSEASVELIAWLHDVNVLGPVRINKAFLPMLEESGGRTVAIGSISGHAADSGTNGAYAMSKFAIEAYTDSLAIDLAETGVAVGIIDPGGFKTPIFRKDALRKMTGSYDLNQDLSKEQQEELEARTGWVDTLQEPDAVADAVMHFMTDESPRLRYMVTLIENQADRGIRALMTRMLQLNANQPFELSRDELVAMLDELLENVE